MSAGQEVSIEVIQLVPRGYWWIVETRGETREGVPLWFLRSGPYANKDDADKALQIFEPLS